MAQPGETPTSSRTASRPDLDAAFDVNEAWGDLGATVFRNMRTWNAEVTRFVGRRLEHDGRTLERLSRCTDVGELARVQQDWISEAADHYLRESRKLAEIAMANGAGRQPPGGGAGRG
jgi:hypothetical protein